MTMSHRSGTPPPASSRPQTISQAGTIRPTYNDGTPIDHLVDDAMNRNLNVGVRINQGNTGRILTAGSGDDSAMDGDTINFASPWDQPPAVMFGAGGKSYENSISGDQMQVFQALNVSTSGFTASLRIKAISTSGTQNFQDDTQNIVGSVPNRQIEKGTAVQASDDRYTFRFTVNANDCEDIPGEPTQGWCRVGFYTRTVAGGAWTKRGEQTYNASNTYSRTIVVDGPRC